MLPLRFMLVVILGTIHRLTASRVASGHQVVPMLYYRRVRCRYFCISVNVTQRYTT